MDENTNKSLIMTQKICKGDKYIPEDFLKLLYQSIDDMRDKTYVMYHAETGLRVSDVLSTEIVHIDWQNMRTYTFDHKKDAWRYVYYPEFVKAQLKMYLKYRQMKNITGKRLFSFSAKTANRIVKQWCKRLGWPFADQVGSHWLRHTFIRLSRKAGRDIKAVQQNTGDTVKTILEWYSDLSREDMQHEINDKPMIRG